MKKEQSIAKLKEQQRPLNESEMNQTKGGWLVTCEEKRGLLGIPYESYTWQWDGSLKITMRRV